MLILMNLTANCLYLLTFLKTPLKHKYAYFFNVNCSLMLLPTTMTITTTIMYFKGKLCFCFRLGPYLFNLMELIKAQHGGYSLASQQEDPGFEATSREPFCVEFPYALCLSPSVQVFPSVQRHAF